MKFLTRRYETPGPGISKNAPKKRDFFIFFQYFFESFWKLFVSNLWMILLSIPIVTSGLGQVGAAYVCRSVARDQHTFGTSDFFYSVKKNWKRAVPISIINILIDVLLYFNIITILYSMEGTYRTVMLGATVFVYALISFARFYQYTLIITFDFSVGQILKNSFLLATIGLGRNILMGIVLLANYAFLALCFFYFGAVGVVLGTVYGLLIFPIFRTYLIQFVSFAPIKKVIIDPYYAEHPDEDIEKRKALGVYDGDDDDSAVFSDESLL